MKIKIKDKVPVGNEPMPAYRRQVFHAGDKVFVASDHTGGICLHPEHYAIKVANRDLSKCADLKPKDAKGPDQPVYCVAHIDLHQHTRADFENALFDEVPEKPFQVIVLHVTNLQSLDSKHESSDNFVWLSMKDRNAYESSNTSLKQFLSLSFEEAQALASKPKLIDLEVSLTSKLTELLKITHPDYTNELYAFQLSCQAWLMNDGAPEKEHHGITIRAPQCEEEWLAPFAPLTEELLCKRIGRTEETHTAAAELFKQIKSNEKDGLKKAIESFLSLTTTPQK